MLRMTLATLKEVFLSSKNMSTWGLVTPSYLNHLHSWAKLKIEYKH